MYTISKPLSIPEVHLQTHEGRDSLIEFLQKVLLSQNSYISIRQYRTSYNNNSNPRDVFVEKKKISGARPHRFSTGFLFWIDSNFSKYNTTQYVNRCGSSFHASFNGKIVITLRYNNNNTSCLLFFKFLHDFYFLPLTISFGENTFATYIIIIHACIITHEKTRMKKPHHASHENPEKILIWVRCHDFILIFLTFEGCKL